MKNILILSFLIMSITVNAQNIDMGNKFNIIDAITTEPIPYVSIVVPSAKLAITSQDNGVFYIPGNLNAMKDTISFYAQNYAPLKLSINQLANTSIVKLAKTSIKSIVAKSNNQVSLY